MRHEKQQQAMETSRTAESHAQRLRAGKSLHHRSSGWDYSSQDPSPLQQREGGQQAAHLP